MKDNIKLWNDITFKTVCYQKNHDFINDNDNIITECDGEILKLRIEEKNKPELIGEYNFSIWNIKLCKDLNISINELINFYDFEDSYGELKKELNNKSISLNNYERFIIIHSLILKEEYRKKDVTKEFMEMIYRNYYSNNTLILGLVKPIQYNKIDHFFYLNHKTIYINKNKSNEIKFNAFKYYNLSKFDNNLDFEKNIYKLFSLAKKTDFERINDSFLFKFTPLNILKRINEKKKNKTISE